MFSRSSLLFTTLAAASMAVAGPLEARKALATSCLPAGIEASCYNLVSSCLISVNSSTKSSIWHNRSCVAAATCFGVGNLENSVACQLNTAVTNQEQTSLDYNIYATIVGDCAWAAGGCPITQQNFIDFYYASLTAINSGTYPASNTVISWWQSIASWTATGNTVPYTNFNDWLHYSTYPSVPTSESPITSSAAPTVITVSSSAVPTVITVTSSAVPASSQVILTSSVAPVTTDTPVVVTITATTTA